MASGTGRRGSRLRLLDCFSGIGGFSLGLEATGAFETVAFCEIEEFPKTILKRNWPNVPIYSDIRVLSGEELDQDGVTIEAICAGFPCQDISNAGLRAGIHGEESGLWMHVARLVGEIRPSLIILENVAALLHRGMDKVLSDLSSLGYNAEWSVVRASDQGAPHARARVFIAAYPIGDRQSWEKPCVRAARRVGRVAQSVAWDGHWENKISEFRGVDDGISNRVDRTDALRNAIVPHCAQAFMEDFFLGHERGDE